MIRKVLVANRGEIAVRVMRTCRAMGIATVALYSDADTKALHRMVADESVHIGPAAPNESYLNVAKILDAAKQTGADAIHPGYGFLSENAGFASACMEAGLTWIGPKPDVIRQLGDKLVARELMKKNGVPLTPGAVLEGEDPNHWQTQADGVGYPLLVKAAAGGGGKGMRIVRSSEEFPAACKLAASEAKSAFGDDRIYLEKYIENPRHIEIQILADTHGNVVHLHERECSIQRRYQKIVEETPSPVITPELRAAMGNTAVTAAKAAGYTNAGTVEFLFDPSSQSYYFLEVNTRLQVEHPITEEVTGLDLVQLQVSVANGEKLPFLQEDIPMHGHVFECRIYAEDPAQNFFPSPGPLIAWKPPVGPGVRVDDGVYAGYDVPTSYDPILAKLVVSGPDRETARLRMLAAMRDFVVLGVETSIPFLIELFEHEAFCKGDISTHFIDEHMSGWKVPTPESDIAAIAAALDSLMPSQAVAVGGGVAEEQPTPWSTLGPFRIGQS